MASRTLGQKDTNGHIPVLLDGKRIGCIRNFGGTLTPSWSNYVEDKNSKSYKEKLVNSGLRSKGKAVKELLNRHREEFGA